MSAESWATCPRCLELLNLEKDKVQDDVEEAYGKVSQEEYQEMVEKARKFKLTGPGVTLREDYWLGIDNDGEFKIQYRGSCSQCNFLFNFSHKEQAYTGEPLPDDGEADDAE